MVITVGLGPAYDGSIPSESFKKSVYGRLEYGTRLKPGGVTAPVLVRFQVYANKHV